MEFPEAVLQHVMLQLDWQLPESTLRLDEVTIQGRPITGTVMTTPSKQAIIPVTPCAATR